MPLQETVVKRLLQLKQRPYTLFLCISSKEKRLMGPTSVARATQVAGGRVNGALTGGNLMNFLMKPHVLIYVTSYEATVTIS